MAKFKVEVERLVMFSGSIIIEAENGDFAIADVEDSIGTGDIQTTDIKWDDDPEYFDGSFRTVGAESVEDIAAETPAAGADTAEAVRPDRQPRIDKITMRHIADSDADTSYLGYYCDELEPGVIVRDLKEYYERLPEDAEIPERTARFVNRGFKPYAGGEPITSPHYHDYVMADFERSEGLMMGTWCYIGIRAEAVVSYPLDMAGKDRRLETFTSGGVWGVESDSNDDTFEEYEDDQLDDLKQHLAKFGIAWNENIEIERGE
jgi:hypothetical protein